MEVEFEEFLERDFRLSEEKKNAVVMKSFEGDREKMEEYYQKAREEYRESFAGASEFEKIAKIINNFHSWLPRGFYRIGYQSRGVLDEKRDALTKDIDEYISNMSDEVSQSLLKYNFRSVPEEKRHQWLAAIFPIYCAMRDKGHNTELLWR